MDSRGAPKTLACTPHTTVDDDPSVDDADGAGKAWSPSSSSPTCHPHHRRDGLAIVSLTTRHGEQGDHQQLRQSVMTCESSVRRRRAHLSRPAPAVRVELLCGSCWGPKAPQGRASAHPAGRVTCSQPRRAGKPHSGSVGTVEQSLPNVEVRSHPLAASTGSGIHAGAPRRYTVSGSSFSARAAPKMRSFRTALCPCLRRCQQRALPALPCGGW
jgi:hypothetical protein